VDHIDRNPSNNRVDNLRWSDRKLQNNNRQICDDSLARYGVRECEDKRAYARALYANNPEFAEREKARNRAYQAKQKALGRRFRRCPDGKQHWLTDAKYNAMFG
jgi:hypothetical protein